MTQPERHSDTPPVGVATDEQTLRRALALVRMVRDPALPGLVLLITVAVAGLAAIAYTVLRVVGVPYVALQLPVIVSGAVGGTALFVTGALLAAVLAERRDRTIARAELREAVDELCALIHLVIERRH